MSEDDKMYEEMQRRFKARDLELRNEREASLKHYQDFLDTVRPVEISIIMLVIYSSFL